MERTMSSEDYDALGRCYFRQQKFDKAVDAFTEAIDAKLRPTVEQYDRRAACYERLKNYNAALKDSREMIRVNKQDIKGYLRMGGILQKVNKLEKAIGIYKYGMEHVPVHNKNFKLLQDLHDHLTRKLSPPEAMDPFAILPIELAQMVALYLPFKNMVNYIRVSKGWKTFLTRNPKLWLDLDLSRARKDVSRVFIRNAVKYSDYKIRSLTVYRFNHSDVLRNVATVCKELEELTFCAGSTWSETLIETTQLSMNLKKLVVKSEVTWNTVYNILRTRPTLEHVEFHAIQWSPEAHRLFQTNTYSLPPQPKLRTLHLQVLQERGQTRHRDFGDFRNFFQESHTPKLETLILRHWDMGRGEADLRDVPLKNVILNMSGVVPRLPESLERLELKLSFLTGGWTAWNDLDRVRQYLPNLKHLSLEDLRGLPATIIDNLLKANIDDFGPSQHEIDNLAHLESLAIRDSHMDDDQRKLFKDSPEERALLTSPPRILTKSLQILDLSGFTCSDEDVEDLVSEYVQDMPALTSLHTVNLSRTSVTGAGVKLLVDHLPALTTLLIDQCSSITSRDIVTYAEKKGINVSFKQFTDRYGGGRKVRYG